MRYLTPTVRRYIYGVALVVVPLLIYYGLVSEEAAPLWVALVSAILVPGLAAANTPAGEYEGEHRDGD